METTNTIAEKTMFLAMLEALRGNLGVDVAIAAAMPASVQGWSAVPSRQSTVEIAPGGTRERVAKQATSRTSAPAVRD
jgi:hypothetical protein